MADTLYEAMSKCVWKGEQQDVCTDYYRVAVLTRVNSYSIRARAARAVSVQALANDCCQR